MAKKKGKITKGNFVIKFKKGYYIENKDWTDKTIVFHHDIKKAKVFTYKEHAESFDGYTLKTWDTEIVEL